MNDGGDCRTAPATPDVLNIPQAEGQVNLVDCFLVGTEGVRNRP